MLFCSFKSNLSNLCCRHTVFPLFVEFNSHNIFLSLDGLLGVSRKWYFYEDLPHIKFANLSCFESSSILNFIPISSKYISFEQKVAPSDNVNYFYLVFCSHVSVEMTSDKWHFSIECLKSPLLWHYWLDNSYHNDSNVVSKYSTNLQLSNHFTLTRPYLARVPWWRKVQAPRISVYCPQWPSFKPLSDFIPSPEASSFLIVLLNLSEINAAVTHPLPPSLKTNKYIGHYVNPTYTRNAKSYRYCF